MAIVRFAIEVSAIGQRTRSGETTLRDVSLAVGPGELVALIGGGGSGTTVLLDAMTGRRPPHSGTVRRAPGPIGYVAAGETLPAALPLARALGYRAALRGVPGRAAAAETALRVAGLADRAGSRVGDLDAGQRGRAAIAAELLTAPALLFLAEPAAGLDPAQSTALLRLLRRLSDTGTTVVLTTSSPADAARCDKVALLAAGGHLAFFGPAEAACGYFGADSLDEIYEQLAGLGDPAAAWSRRFFHFSRTNAGFTSALATASAPGLAPLVPDAAGPHSAGHVTTAADAGDGDPGSSALLAAAERAFADPGPDTDSGTGTGTGAAVVAAAGVGVGGGGGGGEPPGRATAAGPLRQALRQALLLARRDADVLARSRSALAGLAAGPLAVLAAYAVLFTLGALDPGRPGPAFWAAAGGFLLGLASGLAPVRSERGILAAERFWGLSAAACLLARSAVRIPLLAVADAIVLALPAALGRLPGYGLAYLTALLSSAAALALGLLLAAAAPDPSPGPLPGALPTGPRTGPLSWPPGPVPVAAGLPALLLAAALLALLDRPEWADWVALLLLALALLAAAVAVVARRFPAAR